MNSASLDNKILLPIVQPDYLEIMRSETRQRARVISEWLQAKARRKTKSEVMHYQRYYTASDSPWSHLPD
jgi:hypothetical protein